MCIESYLVSDFQSQSHEKPHHINAEVYLHGDQPLTQPPLSAMQSQEITPGIFSSSFKVWLSPQCPGNSE